MRDEQQQALVDRYRPRIDRQLAELERLQQPCGRSAGIASPMGGWTLTPPTTSAWCAPHCRSSGRAKRDQGLQEHEVLFTLPIIWQQISSSIEDLAGCVAGSPAPEARP